MSVVITFIVGLVLFVWCPFVGADGEDHIAQRIERFKLWNRCQPISLSLDVELHDKLVAAQRDLRKEDVIRLVRSRLRAARIYADESKSGLYINIALLQVAFVVSFNFVKILYDPLSGVDSPAVSWEKSTLGQTGEALLGQSGDEDYILSSVSRLTDQFIDDYLRVNGPACSER